MISNFLFRKVSKRYTSMILINSIIQTISMAILILIIINILQPDTYINLLQQQLNTTLNQQIITFINNNWKVAISVPDISWLKSWSKEQIAIFIFVLITITYIIEYILYLRLYKNLSDYCYQQLLCVDYTNYNTTEVFSKTKIGLHYLIQAFQSEITTYVKIIICLLLSAVLLYYKQYIVVYVFVACAMVYMYIIYDLVQKSKKICDDASKDTIYDDRDTRDIIIEDQDYHLNRDLCNNNCFYNWQNTWYNQLFKLLISISCMLLFVKHSDNPSHNNILIMIIVIIYWIYIAYEDWLHGLIFYQYWKQIPKFRWGTKHLQQPLTTIDIKNLCLQKTLDEVTFTTINNLNIKLNCNEFYTLEGFNNLEWQYLTNIISGEIGPNSSIFFNNIAHHELAPIINRDIAVLHMNKKYKKTQTVINYIHSIDPSLKKYQIYKLMRIVGLHINLNHNIALYNSSEKSKFLLLELLISLKRKRFIFISKELVRCFDAKIINYIRESKKYNNCALISNGNLSHVLDDITLISLVI